MCQGTAVGLVPNDLWFKSEDESEASIEAWTLVVPDYSLHKGTFRVVLPTMLHCLHVYLPMNEFCCYPFLSSEKYSSLGLSSTDPLGVVQIQPHS